MKLRLMLLIQLVFFFCAPAVLAQVSPTTIQKPATPTASAQPTAGALLPSTPPHKSVANCDLCGYCQGAVKAPGSWQSCRKCLYPGLDGLQDATGNVDPNSFGTLTTAEGAIPTPDPEHYYTGFGCVSTQPTEFTAQLSSFFFSIIGGVAFLFFIYGSALVATARSDPGRLNQGKRILIGSIVGLLFALLSVFIIRFISQSLGLPGIQ